MCLDLLHGEILRHREVQTVVEATAFARYSASAIGVWRHFFVRVGRHDAPVACVELLRWTVSCTNELRPVLR